MSTSCYSIAGLTGAGTFFALSLYNRITQVPTEQNDNAYLFKASLITTFVTLIVMNYTAKSSESIPCDNILQTFD